MEQQINEYAQDIKESYKILCENNGVSFESYWKAGIPHLLAIAENEYIYLVNLLNIEGIDKKVAYVNAILNSAMMTFEAVLSKE